MLKKRRLSQTLLDAEAAIISTQKVLRVESHSG